MTTRKRSAGTPRRQSRTVGVDDLLDREQVAELLGVVPDTVSHYKKRQPPLPDPVRIVGGSPLWDRRDIEAWMQSRPGQGAGGGRPRKGT